MKLTVTNYDNKTKVVTFIAGDQMITGKITSFAHGLATISPLDRERKGQPPFIIEVPNEKCCLTIKSEYQLAT